MGIYSKSFILLLFLGIILRVICMLWSFNYRENTDVLRYRDRARIAHTYGIQDAYKDTHLSFGTLGNNMPPGSLYLNVLTYEAQIPLVKVLLRTMHATPGSLEWINGPLINAFLRLPSMLADIAIAVLIYLFVKSKTKERFAQISSSLFLFNPVVIYNSAFWGQMDALNNLLFLLSLIFLYKKKYFFSILSFFLSLYIKYSLLFFLPFYFIIVYKLMKNKKRFLITTFLSFLVLCILTLPISSVPHLWLWNFTLTNAAGEMQNITAFAFNFWWLLFGPSIQIGEPINLFNFSEIRLLNSPLVSVTFFGIPLGIWAFLLFGLFSLPLFIKLITAKKALLQTLEFQLLLFATIALIAFLFLPKMHERYMYPIFPLLAFYYGLEKKFLWIYTILTVLHLLNLYLTWHPMMLFFMPYPLMTNHFFQWSISAITVIVGIVFYIKVVRLLYAKAD